MDSITDAVKTSYLSFFLSNLLLMFISLPVNKDFLRWARTTCPDGGHLLVQFRDCRASGVVCVYTDTRPSIACWERQSVSHHIILCRHCCRLSLVWLRGVCRAAACIDRCGPALFAFHYINRFVDTVNKPSITSADSTTGLESGQHKSKANFTNRPKDKP